MDKSRYSLMFVSIIDKNKINKNYLATNLKILQNHSFNFTFSLTLAHVK